MTRTLHGVIRGRTIELEDDPGIGDGEPVMVEIRSAYCTATPDAPRKRGVPVEQVLGLWNPGGGTPPDDEECRRILVEELSSRHSPS